MATSKTTTASSSKKSTAGKTTTKAKKATTAKKPAAKKATRKKSTDIVEVEVINEGTYMSDVARKLAGNYDVEERERELAPMIRAKISGTLESRDQTKYTQMAAEVSAIGQEHVNAAVSGKTDILSRTADGAKIKTDGAEAMRRELAALAVTVNGLGKQSAIARWLPFLASPEKRLREFQARFQSAEESLQDTSDSVHNAALTMTRDADLLDTEAAYQRDRIQDIAADIHAVRISPDGTRALVLRGSDASAWVGVVERGDSGRPLAIRALEQIPLEHGSVVDASWTTSTGIMLVVRATGEDDQLVTLPLGGLPSNVSLPIRVTSMSAGGSSSAVVISGTDASGKAQVLIRSGALWQNAPESLTSARYAG